MLLAAVAVSLLLAATAAAAVGGLTQKPGTAGCISGNGTSGNCVVGTAMANTNSVTISPDGANAYVTAAGNDAVLIFDRNPTTGALAQKAGPAGCITETGSGGCADGKALDAPTSVAISANGANAYVTSASSGAVAIFDRNTTTGVLTQKVGLPGCISDTGTAGNCVDGTSLASSLSVTVSANGANAYVAAGPGIAIFDRNTANGALTQKAGTAGCISETGAGPCADGTALQSASSVTISPDGANVYAASQFPTHSVSIFDRNTADGTLTQKAGTTGCISDTGAGPCVDGNALDGALSVTVSPDGTNAYAASKSSDAITIFDRNPTTGALTQRAFSAGCISETGSAGACVDATALDGASSVALSPDGASAYVASINGNAVAIFDRNTTTGALTQKAGTAGCVSETGAGPCVDGTAISGAEGVTVSPNGANTYVASDTTIGAVEIFDRDLPPETTIDSGPSGLINDSTPSFTFSSGDAGSSFECMIDGGPFGACSGPGGSDTTPPLPDGPHTFGVRAVDPAATPDPTPASRAFAVDATAPETEITKKPKSKLKTKKKKAKVSVSFGSEDGAGFECKPDNAEFESCSSPFIVKAKSKGGKGKKHTIDVQATDALGNVEQTPASVSFTLIRKK